MMLAPRSASSVNVSCVRYQRGSVERSAMYPYMPRRPIDSHSSPITSAKSSTRDMSPSVGARPVWRAWSPSAAAAMPASLGNAVIAPADSLMPARASGSMWLRALDL
jgi:hypothetical protein